MYCCVKHKKNPETDGYERDRSLRSEKLKTSERTITETGRKTETREKRKQFQISVKSVRKGFLLKLSCDAVSSDVSSYLTFTSGPIHRHCHKISLMICLRTIATQ